VSEGGEEFQLKPKISPEEVIAAFRKRFAEKMEEMKPAVERLIEEAREAAERVRFRELAHLTDLDFAEACRADPMCKKTWLRIVKLTNRLNKKMERAVAKELADMLTKMGIDVACSDRTCWLVYKSFVISLRTIARILDEASAGQQE